VQYLASPACSNSQRLIDAGVLPLLRTAMARHAADDLLQTVTIKACIRLAKAASNVQEFLNSGIMGWTARMVTSRGQSKVQKTELLALRLLNTLFNQSAELTLWAHAQGISQGLLAILADSAGRMDHRVAALRCVGAFISHSRDEHNLVKPCFMRGGLKTIMAVMLAQDSDALVQDELVRCLLKVSERFEDDFDAWASELKDAEVPVVLDQRSGHQPAQAETPEGGPHVHLAARQVRGPAPPGAREGRHRE
jgi:hypothetical protein